MRLKLLLFPLIACISFHLSAQTEVGGLKFEDQHWTAANSPYLVTSDVQIPEGYTLTIDPGVLIEFEGNHEVLIEGTIMANGTKDKFIQFKKGNNITNNGNILHFKKSKLENSQLLYCDFDRSEKGILAGQYCTGTLLVDSCNFSYSGIYKESASDALVVIDHSTLWHTDVLALNDLNTTTILVKNSTMYSGLVKTSDGATSHRKGKIQLENVNAKHTYFQVGFIGEMEIRGGTMERCRYNGVRASMKIIDSRISNGMFGEVAFPNAEGDMVYELIGCITIQPTFKRTVYRENTLRTVGGILDGARMKVDEFFATNTAIVGSGLSDDPDAGPEFGGGAFSNVCVAGYSTGLQKFNDAGTFSISNSNFINNSEYFIHNTSSRDIPTTNCYWDGMDSTEIRQAVHDYYKDLNLGKVILSGWRTEVAEDCPISPPQNVVAINKNGKVTVSWDENPEADLDGYRLYLRRKDLFTYEQSIDLGKENSFEVADSIIEDSISIAITAYDLDADNVHDMADGNESWYALVPAAKVVTGTIPADNPSTFMSLFPNPAENTIHLRNNLNEDALVRITNIRGQVIESRFVEKESQQVFDISDYPKGMYLVRMTSENIRVIEKMIKR